MERNDTLETTFASSMRNITNFELDALLHFDSPPPSLRFSRNTEASKDEVAKDVDQPINAVQFNREPLPSQIGSQVEHINYFSNGLDFTMNFTQENAARSQSFEINSMEVESIELNNTEKPERGTQTMKINNDNIGNQILTNNPAQITDETSAYKDSGAAECNDEDIKKELLDLSAFENLFDDEDVASFKNAYLDFSADQELSCANADDINRMCQTQLDVPKQESQAEKPIYTSCPVPIRIQKTPSLPSTISPASLLNLTDFPQNIQTAALDYTHKSDNTINTAVTSHGNFSHPIESAAGETSNTTNTIATASSASCDITSVPVSVKQLYDLVHSHHSDFAFVFALSAQLCQDRVPMDCFVNLKMGCLLSLASISTNPDRPPIPIMAFGRDIYIANFLLTNIAQLAGRLVGPAEIVKPPSCAKYRNCNWFVADPILLADGGVYFAGDWSRLKMPRAEQIFRIIECSQVPVERSTQKQPLGTAIWAHWRSVNGKSKDQQTFNKVVKIFGIPICMDDDEKHDVLVDYILEQSSVRVFESTVDHLSISSEDMRVYLKAISQRNVDLTPEASQLLQKYFVTARYARPECLTKQAYVILKQFSESFAKLCFRHEVLVCDVVAAVFMCERFIRCVYGVSENTPPPFESHNFVGSVDAYMLKFQDWLYAYIKKYEDK
uniref:MCM domain-containing protein 2 n=1 Tax=Ceratitis capitata TaxID=7213 RepID=W8BG89_CERCA